MSGSAHTASVSRGSGRSQSLFYRDLSASPATRSSSFRDGGKPIPTASLWRDNIGGGSDHPPPPIFSLEDRLERSPDAAFGETPSKTFDSRLDDVKSPSLASPLVNLGYGTPAVVTPDPQRGSGTFFGSSPFHSAKQFRSHDSPSWWSPLKEGTGNFGKESVKEDGSPVSGVLQPLQQSSGLLTLPPVREIVRPDASFQFGGNVNESEDSGTGDEWVTVFGFGLDDTNTVMRELEKCGTILRHVPGPGGANWIHVQFQNKRDAQKALYKNGMQIVGALIIGVKPLDPIQRQAVTETSHRPLFNVIPPKTAQTPAPPPKASTRSYYLQASGGGGGGSTVSGPIASPSKSVISKIVDLVFGL